MDENLVGYLLNALDEDTHRQVEHHLRDSEGARQQLEHLRRALEPLAADREEPEPPAGLWLRTLAHVAQDRCRRLPPAPKPATVPAAGASRSWWRRSDLLIAASILLLAALVGVPAVAKLRREQQLAACKDNLRGFHAALVNYSNLNEGNFPEFKPDPPHHKAGIFVPVLNDAGLLKKHNVSLSCPGNSKAHSAAARSVDDLAALHERSPQEFEETSRNLSGCYAYSLGYTAEGPDGRRHVNLRSDSDGHLPILADRPPFAPGNVNGGPGNSPNHGEGQNILHINGNVSYLKDRTLTTADGKDDIYLSGRGKVEAGRRPSDTVLGADWASPYSAD